MSESTIIIERHSWRGFKTVGGELGIARTCGFWTFTYCPFLLSKWLEEKMGKLRAAIGNKDEETANGAANVKEPRKSPLHVVTKKSPE